MEEKNFKIKVDSKPQMAIYADGSVVVNAYGTRDAIKKATKTVVAKPKEFLIKKICGFKKSRFSDDKTFIERRCELNEEGWCVMGYIDGYTINDYYVQGSLESLKEWWATIEAKLMKATQIYETHMYEAMKEIENL